MPCRGSAGLRSPLCILRVDLGLCLEPINRLVALIFAASEIASVRNLSNAVFARPRVKHRLVCGLREVFHGTAPSGVRLAGRRSLLAGCVVGMRYFSSSDSGEARR